MTVLLTLSNISSQQENPIDKTTKRVRQLLNYMATHSEAKNRFRASDMILNVHSDASYTYQQPKVEVAQAAIFPWQLTHQWKGHTAQRKNYDNLQNP